MGTTTRKGKETVIVRVVVGHGNDREGDTEVIRVVMGRWDAMVILKEIGCVWGL